MKNETIDSSIVEENIPGGANVCGRRGCRVLWKVAAVFEMVVASRLPDLGTASRFEASGLPDILIGKGPQRRQQTGQLSRQHASRETNRSDSRTASW